MSCIYGILGIFLHIFKKALDKCKNKVYYLNSTVVQLKGAMFLDWKLDKSRPICPQICEELSVMIASGEVKPDQKLLSVREVAVTAGVNPNTVQKAFEELERQGLIYSVRGSGWFVGQSIDTAKETVNNLTKSKIESFFNEMQKLGLNLEQIKQLVKEWDNE